MPFILQPAAKENAQQRARVQVASYRDDPVITGILPGFSVEEKVKFFEALLLPDALPNVKDLEIVDSETGKVVAFAQWTYPAPNSETNGPQVTTPEKLAERTYPEGTNVPIMKAMFLMVGALSKKYYNSEKMYYLNFMNVDPAYQRRGLGQRLMQQAVLDADRDGAQCFLCATDAGKRLYAKFGFKDVETVSLDFIHLGAPGARNTTAQIRKPQLGLMLGGEKRVDEQDK